MHNVMKSVQAARDWLQLHKLIRWVPDPGATSGSKGR